MKVELKIKIRDDTFFIPLEGEIEQSNPCALFEGEESGYDFVQSREGLFMEEKEVV